MSNQPLTKQDVQIPTPAGALQGQLTVPAESQGMVIFAHGSGSSRHSPRNQFVAEGLNQHGLGTLLFDLLTAEEDEIDQRTRELRFDIPRLAERLALVVDWTLKREDAQPIGLFGASTGAAAALIAAAERPEKVQAVVSRGGRPDLAEKALSQVQAPTLLIVGGLDHQVIPLNQHAAEQIPAEHRLEIVEGATHLFEEPGKLEAVLQLASDWFTRKFAK